MRQMNQRLTLIGVLLTGVLCAACGGGGSNGATTPTPQPPVPPPPPPPSSTPAPPAVAGHPTFLSPHAKPIVLSDGSVFVVNTPADTVDVIDAGSGNVTGRINVGIDPVGLAVRPDGVAASARGVNTAETVFYPACPAQASLG